MLSWLPVFISTIMAPRGTKDLSQLIPGTRENPPWLLALLTLLNSTGGQETSHPPDCYYRVAENSCLIGEHQQFAKMDYGPTGFQTTDHSKMILMSVQVGEKG